MALVFYDGETITVTAQSLRHRISGAVTSGAVVTVGLFDADGVQVGTDYTATATDDDWIVDVPAPMPGGDEAEYTVKITAVKTGATWKAKEPIKVKAF